MKKYRILKSNHGRFKIQYRFLFFFWVNDTWIDETAFGDDFIYDYSSEREAMDQICHYETLYNRKDDMKIKWEVLR